MVQRIAEVNSEPNHFNLYLIVFPDGITTIDFAYKS